MWLATKIKASHAEQMNCVGALDTRINEVEKLTSAVPALVQTLNTKWFKSSNKLKELGSKIIQNREKIFELKNLVKLMNKKDAELPTSYSVSQPQTSGDGQSIAEIMMKPARFVTAVQLGNTHMMLFGGELYKYVQFITMFWNSFDKTINDPTGCVTVYKILMRHVKEPAK